MSTLRLLLLLLLASVLSPSGWTAPATTTNPNKLKANYLLLFAKYVGWPDKLKAPTPPPWHIGILGEDPFGNMLEEAAGNPKLSGNPVVIHRAHSLATLPDCHIVYINLPNPRERRNAINALRQNPVLTVASDSDFLEEGGMILFGEGERLLLNINLDQAKASSLTIQSSLLEVTSRLVTGGKTTIRKR